MENENKKQLTEDEIITLIESRQKTKFGTIVANLAEIETLKTAIVNITNYVIVERTFNKDVTVNEKTESKQFNFLTLLSDINLNNVEILEHASSLFVPLPLFVKDIENNVYQITKFSKNGITVKSAKVLTSGTKLEIV